MRPLLPGRTKTLIGATGFRRWGSDEGPPQYNTKVIYFWLRPVTFFRSSRICSTRNLSYTRRYGEYKTKAQHLPSFLLGQNAQVQQSVSVASQSAEYMEQLVKQQAHLMAAHAQNQTAIAQLAAASHSGSSVVQPTAPSPDNVAYLAQMMATADIPMDKPPANALGKSNPQITPYTGAEDPATRVL